MFIFSQRQRPELWKQAVVRATFSLSQALRGKSFPASSILWWCQAFLGLWQQNYSFFLLLHISFLCVSVAKFPLSCKDISHWVRTRSTNYILTWLCLPVHYFQIRSYSQVFGLELKHIFAPGGGGGGRCTIQLVIGGLLLRSFPVGSEGRTPPWEVCTGKLGKFGVFHISQALKKACFYKCIVPFAYFNKSFTLSAKMQFDFWRMMVYLYFFVFFKGINAFRMIKNALYLSQA